MPPKVSIVVPCYGVEKYLDRCMDTIVNQTLKEIEIILVDDGSPDNVPQMCDEWAAKDRRVKVIHKENGGLGYARNSGLEISNGEYVIFIDSDDYIDCEMMEKLYSAAKTKDYDIVYCGINFEYKKGKFFKKNIFDEEFIGKDQIRKALGDILASQPGDIVPNYKFGTAWSGIVRREILVKNNIKFRSERDILCEDAIFNSDLYLHINSIKYIPFPLYWYCFNDTSLSHNFKASKLKALDNMCLVLENHPFSDVLDFKYRVIRTYMHFAYNFYHQIIVSSLPLNEKKTLCKYISRNSRWDNVRNDYPLSAMPILWRLRLYNVIYNNFNIIRFALFFKSFAKHLIGFDK